MAVITMRAPQNCAPEISVRGVPIKVSKSGTIEVSSWDIANELRSHGFTFPSEEKPIVVETQQDVVTASGPGTHEPAKQHRK